MWGLDSWFYELGAQERILSLSDFGKIGVSWGVVCCSSKNSSVSFFSFLFFLKLIWVLFLLAGFGVGYCLE